MKECNAIAAIVGVFLTTVGIGNVVSAASVPFTENFSGSAPDFTFTSSNANVTALVGADVLTIDSALGTGGQSLNALVNISNADAMPIVMQTDITPTAWIATGNSSAGFLAFSTNPAAGAFPSGPNSGYLADITFPSATSAGSIRILDCANALATIVDSTSIPFAAGSLALNEPYHLTFKATPAGVGFVNLSLTITDTTGTLIDDDGIVTISSPAPVAASTGTFFGYRHRVGNNGTSASRTLDAVYDNFSIALIVSPHPGDFDSDGDVDGADFVAWQTNFPTATGATLAQGDADSDGDVDGADFVVWQTNFPFTPDPGAVAVPEPLGVTLMAGLAAIGLATMPTKRRHWQLIIRNGSGCVAAK
jgi:hypothetical protein